MKFDLGFVLLAITTVSMAASIPDTNSTTLQKRGSTSPGCAEPDDHGNRYRWASCTKDFLSKSGTPNTDEYTEGGYWCWLSWQGNQRTACNDGNAGPLQDDVLCLGHSLDVKNTVQNMHGGCTQ
ncbi:hypothetical protein NUU61_001726 [Penicillium alfredii]|uniref:Uncharacterized protein n=1 Tax=Penicillium alfredii TaxID=1506179 RepID=A0A9W9FQ78_9EURO|nr:uncharacterized protein NUU61_001726 [Penicillium alfredii]KAJ5104379.1 hypothetical protein NUU61_001726 [Penicillium alfredii]